MTLLFRKYLKASMWRRMDMFAVTSAVSPLKQALYQLETTLVDTTSLEKIINICEHYADNFFMIVPR
jgi:hypothetical protein